MISYNDNQWLRLTIWYWETHPRRIPRFGNSFLRTHTSHVRNFSGSYIADRQLKHSTKRGDVQFFTCQLDAIFFASTWPRDAVRKGEDFFRWGMGTFNGSRASPSPLFAYWFFTANSLGLQDFITKATWPTGLFQLLGDIATPAIYCHYRTPVFTRFLYMKITVTAKYVSSWRHSGLRTEPFSFNRQTAKIWPKVRIRERVWARMPLSSLSSSPESIYTKHVFTFYCRTE